MASKIIPAVLFYKLRLTGFTVIDGGCWQH